MTTLLTISHGPKHFIFFLWFDLHDLLFLVKCLQDQENNLEIYRYITFHTTCTRTGSTDHMLNINQTLSCKTLLLQPYRLTLELSSTSNEAFKVVRYKLISFLWSYFINHFNPLDTCTYHLVCPCSNCHATGRSTLLANSVS